MTSTGPAEATAAETVATDDHRTPPRTRSRGWLGLALMAWMIGATAAQLFRTPNTYPWRTVWEEDGSIFLTDALRRPFLTTLHTSYHGYLQTLPRLVSALVVPFPVQNQASCIALAAAAIVALLGAYVWFASADHLQSRWLRGLLVVVIVLLPQGGYETNAALNNVHWFLDFACFWAVMGRFTRWRTVVVSSLIVFVAVLSDPLAAVAFLPLVADYLIRRTELVKRLVVGAWLALGTILQVVAGHGSHVARDGPFSLHGLVQFFAVRVVEGMVIGDRPLTVVYPHDGNTVAYAITLVLGCTFILLLLRARPAALRAGLLVGLALVFYGVSYGTRGGAAFSPTSFNLNASRYTVVPVLLLWWAAATLADHFQVRFRQSGRRYRLGDHDLRQSAPLAGLSVFAVATIFASLSVVNVRENGPVWDMEIHQAVATCRLPPSQRPVLPTSFIQARESFPAPTSREVSVPIAPDIPTVVPDPWTVVIPCSRLLHDLG